jgi:putative SOS response-associated peptidase YedK
MMSWSDLVRLATLAVPDDFDIPLQPSYNVAPTQEILIVRQGGAGPEPAIVRWGLVPFWADSAAIGSKLINARAETVATKPAFRQAFRSRRCLIPANGFFEWRKPADGQGKKQPIYIRLKSEQPFAFAGLWERWEKGPDPLETCTIITCAPNEVVAGIHNRMPVIFSAPECTKWLNSTNPDELAALLAPYPADEMTAYPVNRFVNSTGYNDRSCIEPATELPNRPLVQSDFGWAGAPGG